MRMAVFGVEEEERPLFEHLAPTYGVEAELHREYISMGYLQSAQNIGALNVLSDTIITPQMWDAAHAAGVRFAVTRCVGMAHMNADYARSLGIAVTNVSYSAASVADYAIMMMLMVLRNVKPILKCYDAQMFTQAGLRGRELPNLSVGIIGAGHIGSTVAQHLQGFGCPVYYWDRKEKPGMAAKYLPLDTLLETCDIVSLHLALCRETVHFMDEARIGRMKPGSVLINTGRGALVDSSALISALESGHLSGAGLDVIDGDQNIYYRDHKNRIIPSRYKAILDAMPNVLMLPHLGYLTDQALIDMVENSLRAAKAWRDETPDQDTEAAKETHEN